MKDYRVEEEVFSLDFFPGRTHLTDFIKGLSRGTPISEIGFKQLDGGKWKEKNFSEEYPEFYQMVVSDRTLTPNQYPFSEMKENQCSALFDVIGFCRKVLLDRNKVAAKEILDKKLHMSRNDPESVKGAELERILRVALPEAYSNRSIENQGEDILDGGQLMEKVYDHIRVGEEEAEKIRNQQKQKQQNEKQEETDE